MFTLCLSYFGILPPLALAVATRTHAVHPPHTRTPKKKAFLKNRRSSVAMETNSTLSAFPRSTGSEVSFTLWEILHRFFYPFSPSYFLFTKLKETIIHSNRDDVSIPFSFTSIHSPIGVWQRRSRFLPLHARLSKKQSTSIHGLGELVENEEKKMCICCWDAGSWHSPEFSPRAHLMMQRLRNVTKAKSNILEMGEPISAKFAGGALTALGQIKSNKALLEKRQLSTLLLNKWILSPTTNGELCNSNAFLPLHTTPATRNKTIGKKHETKVLWPNSYSCDHCNTHL